MLLRNLSPDQLTVARGALEYWISHWDLECPILFGLERVALQELVAAWPDCLVSDAPRAALAINGALCELLLGASTPSKEQLPGIIGLEYPEAVALFNKIHPHLSAAIASK